MTRPGSLTLRLTLLFSAVALIGFLGFGWLVGRAIDQHFSAEDVKELKVVAQAVETLLAGRPQSAPLAPLKQRFADILVGHHGALLHVRDAAGRLLYASPAPDLSRIPLPAPARLARGTVQHWQDGGHHYRVYVKQYPAAAPGPYTVMVAVGIDFHLRFIDDFRHMLWLMIAGGMVVMGLLSWLAVRQGHKPLHRIVEQISRISAAELNTRLDPDTVPRELKELALSFNALLERLEEAFRRLSDFSADIAHELRTPVTNLMTQTQVALSQARDADAYREILYSNAEEYERMAQMISDMLFLAQADRGAAPLNNEPVDLAGEVQKLFDYYEAWAEDRHVTLALDGHAQLAGDRLMLRRAISNLLANAIRHTPAGATVSVHLQQNEHQVRVVVHNPGTVIPATHLARIFDRFYRVDPARQRSGEGAGLGLAITQSIVAAHGGEISARSDQAGTVFILCLPRRTEAEAAQDTAE